MADTKKLNFLSEQRLSLAPVEDFVNKEQNKAFREAMEEQLLTVLLGWACFTTSLTVFLSSSGLSWLSFHQLYLIILHSPTSPSFLLAASWIPFKCRIAFWLQSCQRRSYMLFAPFVSFFVPPNPVWIPWLCLSQSATVMTCPVWLKIPV